MKKEKIKRVVDKMVEVTKEFTERFYTDEPSLSPKATEIKELLAKSSYDGTFRKLLSLIVGEDLGFGGKITFKPLCCMVALSNPNSHCYPLNELVICYRDTLCFYKDHSGMLTIGDNFPSAKEALRPATEGEIRAIPDPLIEQLCEKMMILIL